MGSDMPEAETAEKPFGNRSLQPASGASPARPQRWGHGIGTAKARLTYAQSVPRPLGKVAEVIASLRDRDGGRQVV